MKYAVFDVETTGLSQHDEVIQFACILADSEFNIERAYNFYCYTQHPISSGAAKVNHITKELLYKLSDGKTFEDNLENLSYLLEQKDLIWIDYSTSYFDSRMINQTLVNNGVKPINFGNNIATLDVNSGVHKFSALRAIANTYFNGIPRKLNQAISVLPFDQEKLNQLYKKWLCISEDINGKTVDSLLFHTAQYDTFVTYLLLYYNHKRFML